MAQKTRAIATPHSTHLITWSGSHISCSQPLAYPYPTWTHGCLPSSSILSTRYTTSALAQPSLIEKGKLRAGTHHKRDLPHNRAPKTAERKKPEPAMYTLESKGLSLSSGSETFKLGNPERVTVTSLNAILTVAVVKKREGDLSDKTQDM